MNRPALPFAKYLALFLFCLLPPQYANAEQAAPAQLSGDISNGQVTLTWDAPAGVDGYNIYRDNKYITTTRETTFSEAIADGAISAYSIVAFSTPPREYSQPSLQLTLPAAAEPDDLGIPPSTPSGLSGDIDATAVTLSWSASTDDEAVSGYNVYQNNVYIDTVSSTHWQGVVAEGEKYVYHIVAFDIRSNFSPSSEGLLLPAVNGNAVDSPPSAPAALGGTYFAAGATATVSLNWTASTDDGLVLGYNIYQNNAYITTVFDTHYSAQVANNQIYTFSVVAFDNDGLFSSPSDNLQLPEGAPLATSVPPTQVQQLTGNISGDGNDQVQLQWAAASDDRGIGGYNVYANNQYVTTVLENSYIGSVDATGVHDYEIVAFDIDGNFASPSDILTLPADASAATDTEPPTAPTAMRGTYTRSNDTASVTLSWNAATDNRAVVGYNLYENNHYLTTVFDTFYEKSVDTGSTYSYYAVAFDSFGNFSAPSNRISLPEDTNQPPYFQGLADVTTFAGDEFALVLQPVDIDGPVPGMYFGALPEGMSTEDNFDGTRTLRWRPLQPAVGHYDITVVAVDAADPNLQNAETFRLTVELPDNPSNIINLPPAIDRIEPHVLRTGDTVVMEVKATDPNGTVPVLSLLNPPPASTFTQHPEFANIKILRWPTTAADLGTYNLNFEAVDADDAGQRYAATVQLSIRDPIEFVRTGARLKDLAAARNLQLGYASLLQYYNRPDADLYQSFAREEFNLVTTENSMKWGYINPRPGEYRWDAADTLVQFAKTNNMSIHGHTLVWYASLPQWVQRSDTAMRESIMYEFIDTMTARYPEVDIWDVVNESFEEDGSYRDSVWHQAMGKEYIPKAFFRARAGDPDATLIYNDYNIAYGGAKSDATFELMQELLAAGVPIDGIGFQMHLDTGFDKMDSVAERFAQFAALGLEIYITELDISLRDGGTLEQQAALYAAVAETCLAQPACKALQVWGITDRYSWRKQYDPLLFDRDYRIKPAYTALQNALSAP